MKHLDALLSFSARWHWAVAGSKAANQALEGKPGHWGDDLQGQVLGDAEHALADKEAEAGLLFVGEDGRKDEDGGLGIRAVWRVGAGCLTGGASRCGATANRWSRLPS